MPLTLTSLTKAKDGIHKYKATFQQDNRVSADNGVPTLREYSVKFGREGMSDFTKHKDEERKERYLARHKANENWNKPDTAGALSRWILWNKPTLKESIQDYKKRFSL